MLAPLRMNQEGEGKFCLKNRFGNSVCTFSSEEHLFVLWVAPKKGITWELAWFHTVYPEGNLFSTPTVLIDF